MKVKDKSALIFAVAAVSAFAAILAIGTVFDYDISLRLADLERGSYYSDNAFARFFEIFGELPVYLFLDYAAAVFFWNFFYYFKSPLRYIGCGVSAVAISFLSWIVPYRIHGYVVSLGSAAIKTNLALALFEVGVGVALGTLSLIGVMFSGKDNIRKQFSFAVYIVSAIALAQIFRVLKIVNKRVRFRAINAYGDGDLFTPWYKYNGYPDSFKNISALAGTVDAVSSFPSGHTLAAGSVFTLVALPYVFEKLRGGWWKALFYAVSFGYVITVAVARIVMGAHYFTDVFFSLGVSFFAAEFALWLIFRKKAIKPLCVYCGI